MKKLTIILGMFIFSLNVLTSQVMQDTLLVIDFENGGDSIINYYNVSGTPWQIGKPQKTILDSAYNGPNGIITDTIIPYLPGTYSYFEIPFMPNDYGYFGVSPFVCPLQICFEHKSDWDSLSAGGWLSIRDNDQYISNFGMMASNNLTGTNYYYWVSDLRDAVGMGWQDFNYDTLYNDTLGFRISTNSWRKTCVNLFWATLGFRSGNDTLFYRFSFQSDTVANLSHEGWLIDEIQIGQGAGFCAGSIEENNNARILLYPNPVSEKVYISTVGMFEKGSYQLMDLKGQLIRESEISYDEQMSIPVDNIANGVYLLKLYLDGKPYIKRLIKHN